MGNFFCTWLYGTFFVAKTVVEGYIAAAKNLIRAVDTAATLLSSTINTVINVTMKVVVNLVKEGEKFIADYLYNAIAGEDRSIWCAKFWKCLALVNELISSNSWLNAMIKRNMKRKCMNTGIFDIMDAINQSANDFFMFQQTMCSAGLTLEMGIGVMKQMLEWARSVLDEFAGFLQREIRRLTLLAEEYLNTVIDWGVVDWLETIASFFACAFTESASCSELATAQNFYDDALSKFKMRKNGDGYTMDPQFTNAIYGAPMGTLNTVQNLGFKLEELYSKYHDPDRLKKANSAYNLSEKIFPGGSSWEEIRDGNWDNNHIAQKYHMTKENFKAAWRTYKGEDDDTTLTEVLDGTFVDEDGNVYTKDGCEYVLLNDYLEPLPETEESDVMVESGVSTADKNGVMMWNDEIITVLQAAVKIKENKPEDQEMIAECRSFHSFVNEWRHNPDGAIRYSERTI